MTEVRGLGSMIWALGGQYRDTAEGLSAALVGHRLLGLRVDPGEHNLQITTDAGSVLLETEGDCCSETWWADLVGVATALGQEITAVEWVDMPEPTDDRSRQESDVAYGIRVSTTGGVLDLIFRNSSNGYYGGTCNVCAPVDASGWREITEDWQA